MKILVTGANGQVGWELQRTLAPLGEVIAVDRKGMDLANSESIQNCVRAVKPDLIVNAAAYTAVDKAESEPEVAMAVNGTAPGVLAEEARRCSAALIHYSTDYVFDGAKTNAYVEDDMPNPINVYGCTKLAGEEAIRSAGVSHLILRTSWVYGIRGRNFLQTILRLARERDELRIVDDQIGAPTWSRMIAEATAQMLAQLLRTSRDNTVNLADTGGTYHLSAGGRTSWCGFANAILDEASASNSLVAGGGLRVRRAAPIASDQYPTAAVRPENSALSNEKLLRSFRISLPDWSASLKLCLYDLAARHA